MSPETAKAAHFVMFPNERLQGWTSRRRIWRRISIRTPRYLPALVHIKSHGINYSQRTQILPGSVLPQNRSGLSSQPFKEKGSEASLEAAPTTWPALLTPYQAL